MMIARLFSLCPLNPYTRYCMSMKMYVLSPPHHLTNKLKTFERTEDEIRLRVRRGNGCAPTSRNSIMPQAKTFSHESVLTVCAYSFFQ